MTRAIKTILTHSHVKNAEKFMTDFVTNVEEGVWDVDLYAPFVNISKADIAKIGHDLGVKFENTWSCYKGGKIHCGRCGTCVERQEAMYLAGIKDKTEYEDSNYWKEKVSEEKINE